MLLCVVVCCVAVFGRHLFKLCQCDYVSCICVVCFVMCDVCVCVLFVSVFGVLPLFFDCMYSYVVCVCVCVICLCSLWLLCVGV